MKDIKDTVQEIINVLSDNDEKRWVERFEHLSAALDVDYTSALDALRNEFGGMGSFNDIVLQKDGRMLMDENDELERLSVRLFELLKQERIARKNNPTS